MAAILNVNRRYSTHDYRQSATLVEKYEPENVADLQKLVKGANESGHFDRIKVMGGQFTVGSSALPSSASDHDKVVAAIDLSRMNHVTVIHETEERNNSDPPFETYYGARAKVGGGATMRQLLEKLSSTGFQPGVVPFYGNFHIGAISSTPFYDISIANDGHHSHFSTDVVEYKMVLADGSLVTVNELGMQEDDGKGGIYEEMDMIYFIRTHQGLLGIVYEVTLKLYPMKLHQVSFSTDHVSAFQNLNACQMKHQYMYSYPGFENFVQERHFRINEKAREGIGLTSGIPMKVYQQFFKFWDSFCQIFVFFPKVVPFIQLGLQKLYVGWTSKGDELLSPYDRGVLAPSQNRKITLADWHFSAGMFPEAMKALNDLNNRYRRDYGVSASFISVYFLPKNLKGAGYTSKDNDRYAVDMVSYFPANDRIKQLEKDWSVIARKLGGLPALNKNPDFNLTAMDVKRIYGERDYKRFQCLCNKYDPQGLFRNQRLVDLFEL